MWGQLTNLTQQIATKAGNLVDVDFEEFQALSKKTLSKNGEVSMKSKRVKLPSAVQVRSRFRAVCKT